MTTPHHAFFMLVNTTSAWLTLPPADRFAWFDSVIKPILARNPAVTMRYFDSEAFNARVSDVIMWETDELLAYQSVVEELRETQFWGHFFTVVDIVASIEQAFTLHYGVALEG